MRAKLSDKAASWTSAPGADLVARRRVTAEAAVPAIDLVAGSGETGVRVVDAQPEHVRVVRHDERRRS